LATYPPRSWDVVEADTLPLCFLDQRVRGGGLVTLTPVPRLRTTLLNGRHWSTHFRAIWITRRRIS
jgi:hypothetical protein